MYYTLMLVSVLGVKSRGTCHIPTPFLFSFPGTSAIVSAQEPPEAPWM